MVAVQVGEQDEVQRGEVFDLYGRVRPALRAEAVAEVDVVAGVEKVRVGQDSETTVADDHGRRPDEEDRTPVEIYFPAVIDQHKILLQNTPLPLAWFAPNFYQRCPLFNLWGTPKILPDRRCSLVITPVEAVGTSAHQKQRHAFSALRLGQRTPRRPPSA